MAREVSFGQHVRELRRTLDLTQEELARRVGCASVTLRKIETGRLRPSRQIAERLAVALAIPLEQRSEFVKAARAVIIEPPEPRESSSSRTPLLDPAEIGNADLSGRAIRSYQLGERIGVGGFGAVYRAVQPGIARDVAIKLILPRYADHPDFIRRFETEARVIARLEHPHVVPLYDYWRDPGFAFLVMRYLRGGSLSNLLASGPLEPTRVVVIAEQIGSALHVAHRAGIVHRDLKPSNILLDTDGNAFLADFGIAKDLGDPGNEASGIAYVGSPAYSSPEQIRAELVTPQADIYAFGVLLYELLSGQRPFRGPTPAALLQQHLTHHLPRLSEARAGFPPTLDAILQRATAKVPSARYPDISSFVADVRSVLAGEPTPPPISHQGLPVAAAPTMILDLDDADNPYQGLRAFDEANSEQFFGREILVHQLLSRLGEESELMRFLALIGPSGSGKSSLVRAGLLPTLRRGGLPGSDSWYRLIFTPGAHPLEALAHQLCTVAPLGVEADDLKALLSADERGLVRATRIVLPSGDSTELLLVIDQFEELFTLCTDADEREHVLRSLVTAVLDERSRLRIILTLRGDFVDQALLDVDFGELIRQRSEMVLPLTAEELERAIVGPAQNLGLRLEDGLLALMIDEVGSQPGALPLLQHTLSELFRQRSGRMLTRKAYQQLGGVRGALASSAEAIYQAMPETQHPAVRTLLLRLVSPGMGATDTRRRALRSELVELIGAETVARLLHTFGQARLLSFDHDPESRAPTVEVAHEALLAGWPRLAGWIATSREDLLTERRLAQAVLEWERNDRDASFLALGSRLDQYLALAENNLIALSASEQAYLAASTALRDQTRAEVEAQRVRELAQAQALAEEQAQRAEAQRRVSQGLRVLVGALTIFVLVAGGLAAFAVGRQREAEANFTRAEAQRLAAEANQIIARQGNSETAALLALRSIRLQYTPQGDEAVSGAAGLEFARLILAGHPAGFGYAIWSPDGTAIFSGGADGTIRRWDATTGLEQAQIPGDGVLAMMPSGELAIGRLDGVIELRDPFTLELLGEFTTIPGEVNGIAFSPDGQTMGVFVNGQESHFYDVASRQLRETHLHPGPISFAAITRDLRTVATTDRDGIIRIWNFATDLITHEWQAHSDVVTGLAFSPDAQTLLSVSADGAMKAWDVATGALIYTRFERSWLRGVAISPDGRWIATVDENSTLVLWDAATGTEVRRYLGQYDIIYEVYFSPDSRSILIVGADGMLRVYAVAPASLPQFGDHPFGVRSAAIAPDDSTVVTGDRTGMLRMWDAQTGQQRWEQQAHTRDIVEVRYLRGGTHILTTSTDDTIRLWEAASGTLISSITKGIVVGVVAPFGFGVSHDERYVLTRTTGPVSKIWEIATGAAVQQFDGPMGDAIFMPGDTVAVTVFAGEPVGGVIRVWDVRTGELIHKFVPSPGQRIQGIAATPDGKYLAVGISDGVIQLWEYGSWREVGQFFGHTGIVPDMVFSPNGRLLLSAGTDRTARLWDVATRTELRRYVHAQPLFRTVAFTADGEHVLTAAGDGMARLWQIDINATIADLCARVQRDFTPEEREQYGIPDDGPTCPGSNVPNR